MRVEFTGSIAARRMAGIGARPTPLDAPASVSYLIPLRTLPGGFQIDLLQASEGGLNLGKGL
jgi:hypothetical protein